MAGNAFGSIFKLTTFGESHGTAIGGVIDGCPAGISLDFDAIQLEMDRRKPGQSNIVTQRKEPDTVKFLSGVFEGITTGTPIGFVIENANQKSNDYTHIKDVFVQVMPIIRIPKNMVNATIEVVDAVRHVKQPVVWWQVPLQNNFLQTIEINAYTSSVGEIALNKSYKDLDLANAETNDVRCPDSEVAAQMISKIKAIRKEGDTIGGVISCVIKNVPVGLGEPVFDRLHAQLGKAMLSINAVKGFQYGSGFEGTQLKGSQHNDAFNADGSTKTNLSGGIQGGISNGMDIYFDVAFKPVATIMQAQDTIDKDGNVVEMHGKGRHDPCVVPRAVPIVEAMAALVIADFMLLNRLSKA